MKSIRTSRPAVEVAAGLAHAQTKRFQAKLDEAVSIIQQGLALATDAYVACSFGKDSLVMLHLCLSQQPDVSVRFLRWTESELLNNYDEVIAAWQKRFSINLHIADMSRETLDEKTPDRWQSVVDLAPTSGYFIGLRSEESRGRRITLSKDGALYKGKNGLWRIAPLARWTTQDIGAYIFLHDLPMLQAYHEEGMAARTASRVPRKSVRGDALSKLRQRDPQRFDALAAMFPDVREWV